MTPSSAHQRIIRVGERRVSLTAGTVLFGEGGNDTLRSGAGASALWGGDGNDTLIARGRHNFIAGESGNDSITGSAHADLILAGPVREPEGASAG